ncbi:wall-associated receptor kinase 2-like [Fagus crenata]
MLVQVTWVWVGVILSEMAAAAAISFPLALPNCPDMCGDVPIPYPFGLTEGCYLKDTGDFFIQCIEDYAGQPQPFTGNLPVTNISIQGQIDIMMYIALDCYNEWGTPLENNTQPFLGAASFTVSDTQNKFVAVGCDTYAYLNGYKNGELFSTGCVSVCQNISNIPNGTCSGIGCCQMDIPQGLKNVTLEAHSLNNHVSVSYFNPCSFAFIIREDKFNFSSYYLSSLKNNATVPMVFDWAIGSDKCEDAQKNKSTYLCGVNTICDDPENGSGTGYRCNCMEGYHGNPYLKDGCQDIDECKGPNNCTDKQTCVNVPGSYHCSCIGGYHLVGKACVRDQPPGQFTIIIVVGTCTSFGVLSLFIITWWLHNVIKKRKKIKLKQKFFKRNGGLLLQQQLSSSENSVQKTKLFDSKELENATDRFNENRILGKGGQGTVYKGMLVDGRIVAIKKCNLVDEGNLQQFVNEIIILSQINHRNVVKLLGCCLETEIPLLVYEFIPNGTLFQYIHEESEDFPLLTWDIRLRIATEVAGALSYLHSSATLPIYHRDIKSSNILLDDKFRAKVADFGTSRSVAIDQTHVTTLVYGTFGYLDPEYFQTSQFTDKSDVYSFGVVLIELLTGEKPVSSMRSQKDRNLSTYFIHSIEEKRLFDVLDTQVRKEENKEEVMAIANLAKRCLHLNGKKRPTMIEIMMELEGVQKISHDQPNFEELEYVRNQEIGPWNNTPISTISSLQIDAASSSNILPLLSFKSF